MSASLVGSEMCIRDRGRPMGQCVSTQPQGRGASRGDLRLALAVGLLQRCLLYTSDAADDM
eukprot:3456941-Alexandrium_andersonii.AAC.1